MTKSTIPYCLAVVFHHRPNRLRLLLRHRQNLRRPPPLPHRRAPRLPLRNCGLRHHRRPLVRRNSPPHQLSMPASFLRMGWQHHRKMLRTLCPRQSPVCVFRHGYCEFLDVRAVADSDVVGCPNAVAGEAKHHGGLGDWCRVCVTTLCPRQPKFRLTNSNGIKVLYGDDYPVEITGHISG
jgi:hypothetical protein